MGLLTVGIIELYCVSSSRTGADLNIVRGWWQKLLVPITLPSAATTILENVAVWLDLQSECCGAWIGISGLAEAIALVASSCFAG